MSGNRCDHDPENPDLSGRWGLHPMPLIAQAQRRLKWVYWHPRRFPELRELRSERSEAAVRALWVFLAHMDQVSMRVLQPPDEVYPGECGVRRLQLRSEAKLSRQRLDRVNGDLVKAKYLVRGGQPREQYAPGKYIGKAQRWVVSPLLFRRLEMLPELKREQTRVYEERKKQREEKAAAARVKADQEAQAAMKGLLASLVAKAAPSRPLQIGDLREDQVARFQDFYDQIRQTRPLWSHARLREYALALTLNKPPPE